MAAADGMARDSMGSPRQSIPHSLARRHFGPRLLRSFSPSAAERETCFLGHGYMKSFLVFPTCDAASYALYGGISRHVGISCTPLRHGPRLLIHGRPSLSFDPFTDASNSPVTDLPLELVYKIFDILRSHRLQHVSLVLTKKRFYAVLRCLYGSVPLRLKDPNDLEWNVELGPGKSSRETSWLLASQKPRGPVREEDTQPSPRPTGSTADEEPKGILSPLRRHRCELHRQLVLFGCVSMTTARSTTLRHGKIIAAGGRAYREILSLDEARLAAAIIAAGILSSSMTSTHRHDAIRV
ncbi:hypothetical protein NOR_00237 [Metarhizium rileyi]|uniref:F-box domain-containing protein n=1 Tax=Metarhizium rileyi (strain RCEF 4871) TaxID=1649241 RepID=A0A167KF08_METRR|nr:hypothetical protein NOR_00237 [Metarhizium rileyi RCEF 4871]